MPIILKNIIRMIN